MKLYGTVANVDIPQPTDMKFDGDKEQPSILFQDLATPLQQVQNVLNFGAAKYERASWMTLADAKGRYKEALLRHLKLWLHDETGRDEESNELHIAHLVCNAMFLMHFYLKENSNAES